MLFESHWFTMIGRIQYGFMITTMQSRRNEYLFNIGDIYFQLIEYDKLLTMPFEYPDTSTLINNNPKLNQTNEKLSNK